MHGPSLTNKSKEILHDQHGGDGDDYLDNDDDDGDNDDDGDGENNDGDDG